VLSESGWRFLVFITLFLLIVAGELLWPRRELHFPKGVRWRRNLSLIGLDVVILTLLMPISLSMVALRAQTEHFGLLNQLKSGPAVNWIIGLVWMDFVVYWQHRWFHRLPLLWRFHKVHHLDLDIDVTSGLRFHPIEIILSWGIKAAAILFMGVAPSVVLVSEMVINGAAMFNHGNIALPLGLDRWLRRIIVTPDMHRIHHSVARVETDSNYGFCLSWWDYLFSSYTAQPEQGHISMDLGLRGYRSFWGGAGFLGH
jgi:sterol desaturase/sphingolipid hydroxylase (fatty acid hydroxylase superfamily)